MKQKVLIIAEAGVNHNGDISIAKKLIDVAVEAGADVVKFQTFKAENVVTKQAMLSDYQKANKVKDDNQFEMLKKLELSEKDHFELFEYCQQKGIIFFSTAFDLDSIEFLSKFKMGMWKIPSGELTNYPYVRSIARKAEKVILSTGMATLAEVAEAIKVLIANGTQQENITVLQCHTDYPTKPEDVNLLAMLTMKQELGVRVGYSDHTMGIDIALAAVALGATIIEKHFTLDQNNSGPDHQASLSPSEFKDLVTGIRNIEVALGSPVKVPSKNEIPNLLSVRKSIVAKTNIKEGEVFTDENLTTKRPGNGINPMKWNEIIGKIAERDFVVDEMI